MLKAEKVLNKAKVALDMLEQEDDEEKIEVLWIACVTLLRSIGHVLAKVDVKNDAGLKRIVDKWWSEIKNDNDNIFNQFIDKERNLSIKEYEIRYTENSLLGILSPDQTVAMIDPNEGSHLYIPMTAGKYETEDIRDVIANSIAWWDVQLAEIKAKMELS